MAITVNLLTFSKRENSTKVPAAADISAGASYSCTLIDDTSLMNPTFKLNIGSNPVGYNYAYVSDFGRYYFVTEVRSFQNFWYVSCTCDVLATYRSAIRASSHYVLRSASDYDQYISDTVYPSKVKQTCERVTGTVGSTPTTNPFSWSDGHSYVMGVVSVADVDHKADQMGSIVYYWLDGYELYYLMNYLLSDVQWTGIQTTEYSAAMQKALVNPSQYINSCIAIPVNKPNTRTNNTIKFGYYDITFGGDSDVKVCNHNNMIVQETVTFALPKHPQAATRGAFMNASPYTTYKLEFGPFGTIDLDPSCLIDETYLQATINTECCTGMCKVFVRGTSSSAPMIYTASAQIGVPINISQLTRDYLGEVQNQLDMNVGRAGADVGVLFGGLSAAGSVAGSIQSIGGMAFDAVRMKYPTVSGGGAQGSFINMHTSCYLEADFYEIVDQNNTEIGRPLYKTKTLSTLSGFCVCSGADVAITGTQEEAQKVNNYLNTGFYIE